MPKYIKREIENEIKTLTKEFPIIVLLGPRQSGKTTLSRKLFNEYEYVSLEDFDLRELAKNDPRKFFKKFPKKVIIDEIQRAPKLFSYLQTHSDNLNKPGQFVITGSQNYLMMKNISQSLAGRVGIATLLPFSFNEIKSFSKERGVDDILYRGFYPRLHMHNIRQHSFYRTYVDTYLERDIRTLVHIEQYDVFKKFLIALSGRTGQLLNKSSLAAECGISRETVSQWLNILEISYIIFRLPSFHKNYKKQIIKSAKIFFYDSGLVCYLLGIKSVDQVTEHYLRGNIFETMVINEFFKNNFNFGKAYTFYYWRDKKGQELDLVFEQGMTKNGVEIKSSQTMRNDFFRNLQHWKSLDKNNEGILIFDGTLDGEMNAAKVFNWRNLDKIL